MMKIVRNVYVDIMRNRLIVVDRVIEFVESVGMVSMEEVCEDSKDRVDRVGESWDLVVWVEE